MREKYVKVGIVGAFIGGSLLRIWMSIIQFTSCDDLGVAITMLMGERGGWSLENCARGLVNFFMCHWTYAPLQFIVTCLLLSPEQSYNQVIILGRLPSLICGIVVLPFCYLLLKKLYAELESGIFVLFSIVLLSTSFEHIIYSAQMNPYAIGVLASCMCMYLFVINQEHYREAITIIIATFCCYAQWQLFIFVFCFFTVMLFDGIKKKDKFFCIKLIRSGAATVLFNIPNLFFFLHCGMSERGTNWNIGLSGRYLFKINPTANIIEKVQYIISFLGTNLMECFTFLLLPCKYYEIAGILACFLILLTILGMIKLHCGSRLQKQIAIYIDLTLILYFIMIFTGFLTFSPSRHMLVMVPIILVCMVGGWSLICSRNSPICVRSCTVLSLLIIILFAIELPDQLSQRANRFNADYWQDIIKTYRPDIVVTYAYCMDPFLMDIDGYSVEMKQIDQSFIYRDDFDFQIGENTKILLFSNTAELSSESEAKAMEFLRKMWGEHGNVNFDSFRIQEDRNDIYGGATIEYADRFEYDSIGRYGEYVYIVNAE